MNNLTKALLSAGFTVGSSVPLVLTGMKSVRAENALKKALEEDADKLDAKYVHNDKRIKILRTAAEVKAWAENPNNIDLKHQEGELYKQSIHFASDTLDHNAFFLAPMTSKGIPAVAIGKKGLFANKKVLDHELGHFQDYLALKAKDVFDFNKKQLKRGGGFFRQVIDPSTNHTLISETAAWDHTPHKAPHPVREKALDTYRASAEAPRALTISGAMLIPAYYFAKRIKTASEDPYYVHHRNQLLAAHRQYRMIHKAQLAKKAKVYQHKVNAGLIRPQKRLVLGHDYQFIRR